MNIVTCSIKKQLALMVIVSCSMDFFIRILYALVLTTLDSHLDLKRGSFGLHCNLAQVENEVMLKK